MRNTDHSIVLADENDANTRVPHFQPRKLTDTASKPPTTAPRRSRCCPSTSQI